jgi:hypothetical protein
MSKFPNDARQWGALTAAFIIAVLVLVAIVTSTPANAQGAQCYEYDSLVEQVEARFGETPVAHFTAANGNLFVIFSSPSGDSVTVGFRPVSQPGAFCVVADGGDFVWLGGVEN